MAEYEVPWLFSIVLHVPCGHELARTCCELGLFQPLVMARPYLPNVLGPQFLFEALFYI